MSEGGGRVGRGRGEGEGGWREGGRECWQRKSITERGEVGGGGWGSQISSRLEGVGGGAAAAAGAGGRGSDGGSGIQTPELLQLAYLGFV